MPHANNPANVTLWPRKARHDQETADIGFTSMFEQHRPPSVKTVRLRGYGPNNPWSSVSCAPG